jgi:hypothetical protein
MIMSNEDVAKLSAMTDHGPFFFSAVPSSMDAVVFGTLASSVLTPIETPIRAYLRSRPDCTEYAERMGKRFFPELAS